MLENDIVIDKCVYRLYGDGYHMIKVTDNTMVEVNVPQFIRGIQVTSVGQESILDVNPPGFWECEKLRKVIIPEGVKVIGGFNRCVSLTQISLPDTVTDIVSNAFDCCFKLESIRIPRRLKKIGTRAFNGCYSLRSIFLPDDVNYLEYECFAESGLEFVKLPDNLEHLEADMFMCCEKLMEINFPKKLAVGEINTNIFFSDLDFPDWKKSYNKIMKSLRIVRVAPQNENEAKELFGKHGVIVQVI